MNEKGNTLNLNKKNILDFYETYSERQFKIYNIDKTMGIHLGYYEKGIRTPEDAIINMNYFVGKLLNIWIDWIKEKTDRVLRVDLSGSLPRLSC